MLVRDLRPLSCGQSVERGAHTAVGLADAHERACRVDAALPILPKFDERAHGRVRVTHADGDRALCRCREEIRGEVVSRWCGDVASGREKNSNMRERANSGRRVAASAEPVELTR